MTAKELREKRKALAVTIRQMADKTHNEKRDFTAEEKPQWDKVNTDYNDLTRQIEVAERVEAVEADQEQRSAVTPGRENRNAPPGENDDRTVKPTEEMRSAALRAWCATQMGLEVSESDAEACRTLKFNPNSRHLHVSLYRDQDYRRMQGHFRDTHPSQVHRALSAYTGTAGGYTVAPETLIKNLELAMLQYGGIRQVAEVIRTTSGEPLSWPTANDTGNKGRRIAEGAAVDTAGTTTPNPTFGKTTWYAYKYTSDSILVPTELLEDSQFDLPSLLGQMLGERIGRITNAEDTTGTGNAQPNGLANAAAAGITAASQTAITADEVLKLVHSVDPAYRTGAGVGFMMHDSTLLKLRQLKDGQGKYLWQPGMTGAPDRLWDYPYTINQDMPQATTGLKSILFGDLSKFKIRDVNAVRFYRLQELHRETDQDGFVAFLRHDAGLLDAGTHPVKALTQA